MSDNVKSIATFELERELGRGGMGVVWLGRDRRLGRQVAVKMLRESDDREARERLLREARAAASINHPNVCQVYEVGEEAGVLYIAMELLEGIPLSERLEKGPVPLEDSMSIVLDVLKALDVIHQRALVHRDVKPSNVFLTPYGAKLLDFGLARLGPEAVDATQMALTRDGAVLGTPRYMAPEQWAGEAVGPQADLWAIGVIFYEMLTGCAAFEGSRIGELYEAIVHREPPALSGGPAIVAADRVVQRALEKLPANRYSSAADMSEAVTSAPLAGTSEPVRARRIMRLIVLPFRVLRPDSEIDFLSVSLSDAISGALASIESLVVRSSLWDSTTSSDAEIKEIARDAGVNAVVSGTLVRVGDRVRAAAQLAEAPSGNLLWSKTVDGGLEDLFALQDSIVREILSSLTISLSGKDEGRLEREAPKNPPAYEAYLRANDFSVGRFQQTRFLKAGDLYRSSLELQSDYAPAWARLARVYRIMSKYGDANNEENYRLAQEAISKALELDPDLAIAHNYYTYFQIERGEAREAMRRLIERARASENDPDLFAGLVVALRFCGLLEPSVAAHDRARRLDPQIRTGVPFTFLAMGNFERAIANDEETPPPCRFVSLSCLGRTKEAMEGMRSAVAGGVEHFEEVWLGMLQAAIEGDRPGTRRLWDVAVTFESFRDPEGWYLMSRNMARVGEIEIALAHLARVVEHGFLCPVLLEKDPWLESIRGEAEFYELLDRTRTMSEAAKAEFLRLGGGEVLGIPS